VADWLLAAATVKDGVFAVARSGGSTPQRLYENLAGPPYRDLFPRMAWSSGWLAARIAKGLSVVGLPTSETDGELARCGLWVVRASIPTPRTNGAQCSAMSALSIAKSRNPKSATPKKGSAKSNATSRRKVTSAAANAKTP
jgi:hypothetical protein